MSIVAIISPECTNCARFVDALKMSKTGSSMVTVMNLASLTDAQRSGLRAVPTLVLQNGKHLVGTDAFKWLDQFSEEIEPQAFGGFGALPFSDVQADIGFAMFSDPYSTIE